MNQKWKHPKDSVYFLIEASPLQRAETLGMSKDSTRASVVFTEYVPLAGAVLAAGASGKIRRQNPPFLVEEPFDQADKFISDSDK